MSNNKAKQATEMNVSRRVLAKRERHEAMGMQFRKLCSAISTRGGGDHVGLSAAEVEVQSNAAITGPKQRVAVLEAALATLRRKRKRESSPPAATVLLPASTSSTTGSSSAFSIVQVPNAKKLCRLSLPCKVEMSGGDDEEYPESLTGSSAPGSPVASADEIGGTSCGVASDEHWLFKQYSDINDNADDFSFLLDDNFLSTPVQALFA
jgi:hypothetical protein